jgi:hypothetical protein
MPPGRGGFWEAFLTSRTSQGTEADAARVRTLAPTDISLTLWIDADPDPVLQQR